MDVWTWTSENPYPPQESAPAYLWLNRRESDISRVEVIDGSTDHVKENRDYFEEVEGFDGTVGVGVGLLSARPSTCAVGVGYWATDQGNWNKSGSGDQGVLYKCTSTNSWELYYTPYEYPHPFRSLAAPSNLRVIKQELH
jgi:hypothetical protein